MHHVRPTTRRRQLLGSVTAVTALVAGLAATTAYAEPGEDHPGTLSGPGMCGGNTTAGTPEQARCGVGPRLPLLVVSPYSRQNFVDNSFTSQTSVVRFVEDNWLGGQRIGGGSADATTGSLTGMLDFGRPTADRLFLDPTTGQPLRRA